MIRVTVDDRLVRRQMDDLVTKNLPFATARALTWVAMDAQKEIRRELPRRFIIRNTWTAKGVRVTPANKRNQQSEVYSKDDWMVRQEEGGVKRPTKGTHLAVPVNAKRNKRDIVTKANRPRPLLSRKDHFKGKTKGGSEAIFQRLPGDRLSLKYVLPSSGNVKPRWDFKKTVEKVVDQRFERLFSLSLGQALR